jgi:hypothetical protein
VTAELRVIRGEGEPSEYVIEAAETALARAKSGEIKSIAVAFEYRNGEAGYHVAHGKNSTPGRLLGEVALMQHAIAGIMNAGLGAKPDPKGSG